MELRLIDMGDAAIETRQAPPVGFDNPVDRGIRPL
jgi:hypothetical protein